MNKQRKVVITTTYNEMGIIIDTKAEEVAQPNLQPTCNQLAKDICVPCKDTISRQEAIDALDNIKIPRNASWYPYYQQALTAMSRLPSAYPETDGFCTDCKEYDSERHFCPRFDRVIKKTVEEMQIIHCKDCRKHNVHSGYKDDCCPLYEWRGMSYGHEHDYQYCSFAERRLDEP